MFLVRTICHDWPDELVIKILSNLREAAGVSTRLLLADFIIPYACPSNETIGIPGAQTRAVKAPLLANLGKATANAYWIDMTVSAFAESYQNNI